ncbi:MAG: HAD family hydrolase [Nitrospinaceae bacterium]
MDKTGTITKGEPAVTDIFAAEGYQPHEILSLAASAEKGSEHPLGEAIVEKAKENELKIEALRLRRFKPPSRGVAEIF